MHAMKATTNTPHAFLRSRLRPLLGVLPLLLLLAACGANGADDADSAAGEVGEETGDEVQEDDGDDESAEAGETYQLHFGSATSGGTGFAAAQAIAEGLHSRSDVLNITVQETAGSGENAALFANREIDLGVVFGATADQAYTGAGAFEGAAVEHLRSVGVMWQSAQHIVVPADSDIETVADLAGREVAIGSPGSGGRLVAETHLDHFGIEVERNDLSSGDAAAAMRDGQVDAIMTSVGIGASFLADLGANMDLRFLDLRDDAAELVAEFPWLFENTIPAGTYAGQDDDIATYGESVPMTTHDEVPGDAIYEIARIAWGDVDGFHDEVSSSVGTLQDMLLEKAFEGVSVPLHDGAIRFYEEAGVDIPDHLR